MERLLRDLSGMEEYVPGRGVDEVAREHGLDPDEMAKLASNENPLGPPPAAVDAIRDAAAEAHVYPTWLHEETREAVADHHGVPADNVVLGAGADGVFDTIGRAVIESGDAVLTPSPGFSYYGMSARNQGGTERSYELLKAEDFTYDVERIVDAEDGEKLVYVTTPNNPTGTAMPRSDVERLADRVDGAVVVDEAYHEFADTASCLDLPLERDDVVVSRTFSKAYGLAGLRVGYAVVPDWLAAAYRKVVTPFAVGALSLRAAQAALEDADHLDRSVERARSGRERLAEALDVATYPSQANFVLCDVAPQDAGDVAAALEARGVIVRDTTSFGLPHCIRVSVGTEAQTERAIDAINEVCG